MCTAIGWIYKLDTIEAWFRQLVSGCVIDEVIFFFYNHKLEDVEPICFYTSFGAAWIEQHAQFTWFLSMTSQERNECTTEYKLRAHCRNIYVLRAEPNLI